MTNMTLQALRSLVADDAYASSYQSMAHYRGALLRHFDSLTANATTLPAPATRQVAAPGELLVILRDLHDTLAGESDSDIDHFEDDDEEREGAPVQYAARKLMEVIDMIKATVPSVPTPEAPVRRPAQRRAGPGGWK